MPSSIISSSSPVTSSSDYYDYFLRDIDVSADYSSQYDITISLSLLMKGDIYSESEYYVELSASKLLSYVNDLIGSVGFDTMSTIGYLPSGMTTLTTSGTNYNLTCTGDSNTLLSKIKLNIKSTTMFSETLSFYTRTAKNGSTNNAKISIQLATKSEEVMVRYWLSGSNRASSVRVNNKITLNTWDDTYHSTWYLDEALTKSFATAGQTTSYLSLTGGYDFSENLELYGNSSEHKVTLTYDGNGGTPERTSDTVQVNYSVNLPNATRTGYKLSYWSTASSGGEYIGVSGASYHPTASITLYAQWTRAYTVTYNGNGGTPAKTSDSVSSGSSVVLPTATKTNCTLFGWFTTSSGGTKAGNAGASYKPTADITLYALWRYDIRIYTKVDNVWKQTRVPIKVDNAWKDLCKGWVKVSGTWAPLHTFSKVLSFNSNGGTGTVDSISGSSVTIPANTFTRTGYRFSHWNTSANGSGTSYSPGATVTLSANLTLYAIWVKTYTLTYYKIYNHDYPTFYPPASNTGPVTNDSDGRQLLDLQVNGVRVDGLFDKFTVDDKYSPTRTMTVDEGATLYVYVGNDYSGAYSEVWRDGTRLLGPSVDCTYTTTMTSNMTFMFTWETEGTIFSGTQSYWVCGISTTQ